MPLLLKAAARGRQPTLWSGVLARPLAKPGKDPHTLAGYRSIALLECAAKAVGKALRGQLLAGLEGKVQPGVAGARQGMPLEVPALSAQAFLDYLRQTATSGALLLVDGVSAFYATNRRILLDEEPQAQLQWIQALPVEDGIKELYTQIVTGQSTLERAQIGEMARRLVEIGFATTWFTCTPDDNTVYRTMNGTIPGAPLADLLFQLVMVDSFQCLRMSLQREDLLADIDGHSAELITWLDDVAVPVLSCRANSLDTKLQKVANLTAQAFRTAGILVNFQPGKTEAVVVYHGAQSQACRRRLFVERNGKLPVLMPDSSQVDLTCTDSYVHLGTLRCHHAKAVPDIHRRRDAALPVCRKVCQRILRNPVLGDKEKVYFFRSLVLNRFMYGLGTWAMPLEEERRAYATAYMALLRQAVRPMTKVPCWRLKDEEICAILGLLTPKEALHLAHLRLLAQVCRKGTILRSRRWTGSMSCSRHRPSNDGG